MRRRLRPKVLTDEGVSVAQGAEQKEHCYSGIDYAER